MSTIALIALHWNLSRLEISFTPEGFNYYLFSFSQYKALFTGTIAVCAAYFGLQRVKVSEIANREKAKQDYFNEWRTVLQIRLSEIEKNNPIMFREIIRLRHSLYNILHEKKFNISNENDLNELLDNNIQTLIPTFEMNNKKYIKIGGVYRDVNHSYSFDSFRFVFWSMIETGYDNLNNDLKQYYITNMPNNRTISLIDYNAALNM